MCISLLSIEIKYFPKDTWSQDAFHTGRKPHTTPMNFMSKQNSSCYNNYY